MLHRYMIFLVTANPIPCCNKLILDGNDDLKQLHGDKLGVYEKTSTLQGGSPIFKRSGDEYYLYRSPSMNWTVRDLQYQNNK